MMTIREDESAPAAYPSPPEGLSVAAAAIPPAAVWGRIEEYTRVRWAARQVTWSVIANRRHYFAPPLAPWRFESAQVFDDLAGAWVAAEVGQDAWGQTLERGRWMLTYTIGDDDADVPPGVLEAYRRLAEYWAEAQGQAALASVKDGDYAATFNANRMADALRASGAADLLRAYR